MKNGCGLKLMGSHFGIGAPPILVYLSGDWDVHWGYGVLTHGQMCVWLKTPELLWTTSISRQVETIQKPLFVVICKGIASFQGF